ncbi:MAG: formate dehydrogenase, partial [Acetobacteraceae bacterium]|nr:formate dehydrogenase [Acetobacteraceae bacterium]
GEAASSANERGYEYIPKLVGDHSNLPMTLVMADGAAKGLFVLGQNPVVGAVNSDLVQRGLSKLEWMVVRDFALTETAEFWSQGRIIQKGEFRPEEIGTEVFFLPSAKAAEKDGTVTSTGRLVQWHDVVCDAPGYSRSDLWFIYHLGRILKRMYALSKERKDKPIQVLTWDYPVRGEREEPDAEAVLKEINGYTWPDRKQIKDYHELKDDGSTACGGWMYSGIFPEEGKNKARERVPDPPEDRPQAHLGWAFAWPSNRRTLYNRASADPEGRPWSEKKKMIWWDEAQGEWTGFDVPDFPKAKRPDYRPNWRKKPTGMEAIAGDNPFINIADGRCALFVPSGLKDGPLPTHYEPTETPLENPLYNRNSNPVAKHWPRPGNDYHEVADPRFPHIFTTYRLTELHCGGIATRAMPHTAELQPEAFVEIPPELAGEHDIRTGDWAVISTLRGEIEARALVTDRLRPFTLAGRRVFEIGMPWVYGWKGFARGDIANVLLAIHGDPNVSIHGTKALTCNLQKGRLA